MYDKRRQLAHWQGAESLVCSASGNYAECELYWLIDGGHYCVEFKKFGATNISNIS
jgi:hypothetical protein